MANLTDADLDSELVDLTDVPLTKCSPGRHRFATEMSPSA